MKFLKQPKFLPKYSIFFLYISSSWLVLEAIFVLSARYTWHPRAFDTVLLLTFMGLVGLIVEIVVVNRKEKKRSLQKEKVRILLVDDEKVIRDIIKSELQEETHFTITDEASDGSEALELMKNNHYDLVLTDIEMPKMDGISLCSTLNKSHPELKIIALTMFNNLEKTKLLLNIRVGGYLEKDALGKELKLAIRAVLNGGTYYSATITKIITMLLIRKQTNHIKTRSEKTYLQYKKNWNDNV